MGFLQFLKKDIYTVNYFVLRASLLVYQNCLFLTKNFMNTSLFEEYKYFLSIILIPTSLFSCFFI